MPRWDARPAWVKHEEDGYVLASQDPFTGIVETVEPLYVTHDMGDEGENNIPVIVLHTVFAGTALAYPILDVLIPPMCGHFAHGAAMAHICMN